MSLLRLIKFEINVEETKNIIKKIIIFSYRIMINSPITLKEDLFERCIPIKINKIINIKKDILEWKIKIKNKCDDY